MLAKSDEERQNQFVHVDLIPRKVKHEEVRCFGISGLNARLR